MRTISVKIDPALYAWLERQSKLLGRSKSALVRDALIEYRKQFTAESVTERAGNLVGKYYSGVKDLATNKKYMKGFGEWKR